MDRPRARPRFSCHHALDPDAAVARVTAYLATHGDAVVGRGFRRTIVLTMVEARRHVWTPHLDIQFTAAAEGGTNIDGTFAPETRLWTTFVATQLMFGTLALGLAIYVLTLWSLDQDLLVPALALAGALIGGGLSYGTAYIGQGLGSEQMYELRSFLDDALREPSPAGG